MILVFIGRVGMLVEGGEALFGIFYDDPAFGDIIAEDEGVEIEGGLFGRSQIAA